MDMEIEGLDLQEFDPIEEQNEDFCTSIISQFGKSNNEQHLNLCNVIGTMSQGLKDNNVPLLPAAYFGSIVSSLDRLCVSSDSSSTSPDHNVEALLTLMSLIMPRIPVGSLRKRKVLLLDLLVRVLQGGSCLSTDGVAAGLSCVSVLLVIRDSVNWSDVSQYYGFLLAFVTHSDSKVRKQSHICIRDVLQSFQRCPLLAPASERFTSMFQKLVLLAGASKGAPAEIAQEILHVLEALKDCLPYISMKYKTSILKYYKTLLGVRKPLVTRRITDSLYVLCLDPSVEVKPEDLVDLLSTLATSVQVDETSADGMNVTARLLDVGMRKVYNLNRQICVDKLPLVLNALQDIFGSGFEEAKFAATESLKNLIQACVDEDLIKKGVDRANSNLDFNNRKSATSIIEKICATIGSFLDNRYSSEWDMAFQIVSLMFDKLGTFSSVLLRGSLESLASIEKESEEDFPERKKLQDCIGSALAAVGPEVFLRILPLNLEADTLSDINGWLFPILKQYTVGARMRFYVESLLGMVENLKQKSKKLKLEGQVQASRYTDRIVYQVWTLLPSFCNYPLDTAESFKLLEEVLCNALYKEPDLQGIICSSLQILIQQNKCILEGNNYIPSDKLNAPTERAIGFYNQEVASANLGVLRSSARNFLLVLFNAFLNSTNDPGGSLLSTIGEFASIAGEDTVSKLLRKEMKQLLKFTDDGNKRDAMEIDFSSGDNSFSCKRAQHFDLAVSLLPGLGPQDTDILFSTIIPALEDVDGLIQKKAYKVLSMILKISDGFISRKIEELLKLMSEVRPKCHFSAKRHRLDCLYFVIVHVIKDEAGWDKISPFIVEIVLALKEVNKKTRNRAYDILVQIGHACDEEKGGKKEQGGEKKNLFQVFEKVAAGLASDCSHMISATVKGLARLAYEFSDCLSGACDLFSPSLLLLEREDKEIIKANLGLLKVLVAKSPSEILQIYLKGMVDGILVRQDDSMKHFKAKVKHLLEMLVKKCGLDAIKAVMPEDHMKLLTNIRKIKERKERKLASNSETSSYLSRATTSRHSGWGHTKIFSDFDEEFSDGDDMDAGTSVGRRSRSSSKLKSKAPSSRSRKTRSGRSLLEVDLEDEPLDLLDQRKTRLALRSGGNLKRKLDSEDEPEFDEDGRLIIREEGKPKSEKYYDDNYEYDEDKTDVRSFVSSKSKKADQKRRKTSESGWAYTGNEYASKKARGDVKKKGKFEPYAYWPLDRKMLSRRPEHRAAARRGMRSVVKLTKKLEGRSVASALSIKSKVKKAHKK